MFQVDLKSRKTIYEQVVDNIKELIMTEVLKSDERLPSVRELSGLLTVNPNTVQKAYRELERQGFIYTAAGVGCFVSQKDAIKTDEAGVRNVLFELKRLIKELKYMGLKKEDILAKAGDYFDGGGDDL